MAASLLDLLNREKELVDQINAIDEEIEEFVRKLDTIREQKIRYAHKLTSIRSCLASYVEKNLIKLPNNDPYKHPEVNKHG